MPRRPRIQLDRVPLHIVQRGHNREPCFFGEEDYLSYLYWLGEALAESECELHAYVPARVKVVVASVMQPTVEYRYQPNASL